MMPAWWFEVTLVLLVGVLAAVALYASARVRDRRRTNARFEQVRQSLVAVFETARRQQGGWLKRSEELSDLDPDFSSHEALRRLLAARVELAGAVSPPESLSTVESLVDVIQTMLLVNDGMTTDFDTMLLLYHQGYDRLRASRLQNQRHHARLQLTVEFLQQMGTESNAYSERLVLNLLATFQEITQFSQGIGHDVRDSLGHLMDPSNPEGLHAVNHDSRAIQEAMNGLLSDAEAARAATERAVDDNLAQMERVQSIAKSIEDFSESIRMISLNLNIEAARAGHHGAAGGKGIQVLASKLSEFAVKAQELAAQQQDVIGTAAGVLRGAGKQQKAQFAALMQGLRPLGERLTPFARIVSGTFEKFERVQTAVDHLAVAIEKRLQEAIGQFQFQDLVRQEQEHILSMFGYIRDRAGEGGVDLDETERTMVLNELLDTFAALATTENETRVLQRYRNAERSAESRSEADRAGSVELF